MRFITSVFVCVFTSGLAYSDDHNYEAKYAREFGTWTANYVIDRFDESQVMWFVFQNTPEDGVVRFICAETCELKAKTGSLASSLGSMWSSEEPIKVKIKIDKHPILESEGKYPNTLAVGDELNQILARMRTGQKMRIRTIHLEEMHSIRFWSTSMDSRKHQIG